MMREGAHAREARTILPSRTLPSHTSMLTGVQPEVHGIPWIAWGRGVVPGEIPCVVGTTSTAATTLWLLGIRVPGEWEGTPVEAAFGERETLAGCA